MTQRTGPLLHPMLFALFLNFQENRQFFQKHFEYLSDKKNTNCIFKEMSNLCLTNHFLFSSFVYNCRKNIQAAEIIYLNYKIRQKHNTINVQTAPD